MQASSIKREFGRKLDEQLKNIRRANREYDRGHTEAALIIAAALRIIFHDKDRQVSLLTHLRNPSIRLRSSAPEPTGLISVPSGLLTKLDLKPDALRQEFGPLLDKSPIRRWITVREWWEDDLVYKDPNDAITINRRDLVLAVAEQDGGVHVDAKLQARYRRIVEGALWGMNVNPPNGSSLVVTAANAHLAPLRQMGWELEHSPDLIRLTRTW